MNRKLSISARERLAFEVVLLLLLIQFLLLVNTNLTPLRLDWLNVDWRWYSDGMERVLSSQPLYDPRLLAGPYDLQQPSIEFTWEQSPSTLVVLAPFYVLPEVVRSSAFFIFSTSCALAAFVLVWPRTWQRRDQLLLALLLAPAAWAFMYWGNLITLTALGVALTWIGYRRQSTPLMAIGLLCAGVVKIIPALVLGAWLLSRRHFKPVLLAAALGTLTLLPAVLYQGPQVLLDFITVRQNSLLTFASTSISPSRIAAELGIELPGATLPLFGLILLAFAFWPRRQPTSAWLLLVLAMYCFVVNLWVYWLFLLVVMLLAWASIAAPRLERLEAWFQSKSLAATAGDV